jgi:hypothetical protein
MCGRYEAGQKQKIAEAFKVSVELDDLYFAKGKECAPGSIQPVIYMRYSYPDRLLRLFHYRFLSHSSDSPITSPAIQSVQASSCIRNIMEKGEEKGGAMSIYACVALSFFLLLLRDFICLSFLETDISF